MSAPAALPALGPTGLTTEAPTALAPMASLTDSLFRRLIKRQGGCGLLVTEMVSARALVGGCRRARALLDFHSEERPIGAQLAGADADVMAEAARRVESLGFDFVDVNMGCPARKVVHVGGGSAMMRDLDNTERVLLAIRRAITLPLTVKLRAGWDDGELNAPEVARLAEHCGAALITVHARTRLDGYRPTLREAILSRTREVVSLPVLANGDVRTAEQARAVLHRTGCQGVMVGRGAVADPWLLGAIARGGDSAASADRARRWILDHFSLLSERSESARLLSRLKTYSGWYTRGLMGGAALRGRINRLRTVEEFVAAVEEFFDTPPTSGPGPTQPVWLDPHQELRP